MTGHFTVDEFDFITKKYLKFAVCGKRQAKGVYCGIKTPCGKRFVRNNDEI